MVVAAEFFAAAWLVSAACVACSSSDHGDGAGYLSGEAGVATCPTYTRHCSGAAPSFAAAVAPTLDAHCVGCHNPAGEYPTVLLDSYAGAATPKLQSTVPNQVNPCLMPPAPLEPLSNADQGTLYCWFTACFGQKDCHPPE